MSENNLSNISKFIESTTNETIAIVVMVPAVVVAAYLSIKSGDIVFLKEAGMLVLGYFFSKKASGAGGGNT